MKISITDKGEGIAQQFARAIGAKVDGRFIRIPDSKGGGYMSGFNWGKELRMMIRNYHLKEEVVIDRKNELAEGQDDVVFRLNGIFPTSVHRKGQFSTEQPNVLICKHAVSSVMEMPSNTLFGSVTIAASRQYLRSLFEELKHPIAETILKGKDNFIFETSLSSEMLRVGSEILDQPIPENLERYYYNLKCQELLCHIFSLLIQRDPVPASSMHLDDIKAIYAIKIHLQSHLNEPPNIASLATEAGMSEPKLRKLFKQTFGKGVFEYYQSARVQEAARLFKEKKLTVSEVGYQLGFTNLSHFSREFEKYIGMKPKKYSLSKEVAGGA
ncbi:AraC family transcriptional regulator [Chryseolinea sp. T2]|uniref:helix-turn-helix domain-containing protein n=1 Tax=Chryseolinea sp. T2 TaxID=3129255 RepID=UPI003077EC4B